MKNPTVQAILLIGGLAIFGLCGLAALGFGGYAYYNAPQQAELREKVHTFLSAEPLSETESIPTEVVSTETPATTDIVVAPGFDDSVDASNEPELKMSGWKVIYHNGAGLDRGDGTTFRDTFDKWNFRSIAPDLWPTFPNVPNPLVPEFRVVNGNQVPDGLEYAMDESNFCQQLAGEDCRVPVAAMHYLLFTGDYDIPEIGACEAKDGFGCELVIVNVGNVTADITGIFSQGFRLHARYWNGDELGIAIWGLTSHAANNMLNMESKLNPEGIQNAGANCSVPNACEGVDVRVVFISGNELLVTMETTVQR